MPLYEEKFRTIHGLIQWSINHHINHERAPEKASESRIRNKCREKITENELFHSSHRAKLASVRKTRTLYRSNPENSSWVMG